MPVVLIVEDEPLVRVGACNMIEDAGFEVIEAASADEAIRILESRSDIQLCSQTFICQAQWTASGLLMPCAVGGRRSR
jgi:CheY-like chemotaxis protein